MLGRAPVPGKIEWTESMDAVRIALLGDRLMTLREELEELSQSDRGVAESLSTLEIATAALIRRHGEGGRGERSFPGRCDGLDRR